MSTLKQVLATVDISATLKPAVTVFEYELPVLDAIHGSENETVLTIVSSKDVDVGDLNAAEAFNTLLRKYPAYQDVVRSVYRNAKVLARETGLPYEQGDDTTAKPMESQFVVHEPAEDVAAAA